MPFLIRRINKIVNNAFFVFVSKSILPRKKELFVPSFLLSFFFFLVSFFVVAAVASIVVVIVYTQHTRSHPQADTRTHKQDR